MFRFNTNFAEMEKQKYRAKASLTRKMPERDISYLITKSILENLIEESVEKAQMKEFVKSAPGLMSSVLLSFSELCLCQNFTKVEIEDPIGNKFGSNINPEPEPIPPDNWIRKTAKISQTKPNITLESQNFVKSSVDLESVKSKGSKGSVRRRKFRNSLVRTRSRLPSMSSKNSNKTAIQWDKIVVPEPVKIDNNLEQDFIPETGIFN